MDFYRKKEKRLDKWQAVCEQATDKLKDLRHGWKQHTSKDNNRKMEVRMEELAQEVADEG